MTDNPKDIPCARCNGAGTIKTRCMFTGGSFIERCPVCKNGTVKDSGCEKCDGAGMIESVLNNGAFFALCQACNPNAQRVRHEWP